MTALPESAESDTLRKGEANTLLFLQLLAFGARKGSEAALQGVKYPPRFVQHPRQQQDHLPPPAPICPVGARCSCSGPALCLSRDVVPEPRIGWPCRCVAAGTPPAARTLALWPAQGCRAGTRV